MKDKKNLKGLNYWDSSWDQRGVNSFSVHSTLVENAKWNYLKQDLKGRSGISLEVGCGSGHFSALLAQMGFKAILLDYSKAAIVCARNSFTGLGGRERKQYVVGDALQMPVADESIDVVVSCGVLEHFENPVQPMREMARVLQPGGLFYADICPRKFSLKGMLDFLYHKPKGWYEASMSKNQIQSYLKVIGLQSIRIFAAGVLPPINIPGKGRLKIDRVEKFFIPKLEKFWSSMDDTRLADWLGFYFYVTACKI